MYAIETNKLTKRYGKVTAVDGLDLAVFRGELFSLLGLNGVGKTTTIKMLTGLSAPTSGEAWICGNSILTDSSAAKALLGVSPQETAVAPNLTVKENLELMCGVHGFPREKTRERTVAAAQQFCLMDILQRKAGKLSGGWQRRLSLAMALITEPEVLFLDEPSLGMDVLSRSELWDAIRSLKGSVTIILTTHYMEEAEALSDRVGIMGSGKLLTVGTLEEIKDRTGCKTLEEAFIALSKEGM